MKTYFRHDEPLPRGVFKGIYLEALARNTEGRKYLLWCKKNANWSYCNVVTSMLKGK